MKESLKSTEFYLTTVGAVAALVCLVFGLVWRDQWFAGVGAGLFIGAVFPYTRGRSLTKTQRVPTGSPRHL